MNARIAAALLAATVWPAAWAAEPERSDLPKERLALDDQETVANWYNGSPEETILSASDRHTKQGKFALKFANVVDHTKGEKNYPVGWPRAGMELSKRKLSDWSDYDFFECWIYVESSRSSLPQTPLGIGFYHSGHRRTTSFRLKQVKLGQWTHIVIPVTDLATTDDVQRVQWNISESDYKHGDSIDFYIDDVVLTRLVHPVIAECHVARKVLYATEGSVTAHYRLMGDRGREPVKVELQIGRGNTALAAFVGPADPLREISLSAPGPLQPGTYWARLSLRGPSAERVDQREMSFRVIEGPF